MKDPFAEQVQVLVNKILELCCQLLPVAVNQLQHPNAVSTVCLPAVEQSV